MTRTPLPTRPRLASRSPAEVAARDRLVRDALLDMRPLLKRREPGRYLWDDVASKDTRTCWATICTMLEIAADRGVPLDRLLSVSRAFDTYARSLHASRTEAHIRRSLGVQLVEEARS